MSSEESSGQKKNGPEKGGEPIYAIPGERGPARAASRSRVTIPRLKKMKKSGKSIVALTAYDATFAALIDGTVDIILVGDSLGMVIQGRENTLAVTIDDMIYHTKAVCQTAKISHVVADMPFLSYLDPGPQDILNAGRLLKEGGAQAVKIEGPHPALTEKVVRLGIPVMGHLGLLPQRVHATGGFRVQGRRSDQAEVLIDRARELENAGAYAIVIEAVPAEIGRRVSESLSIPTIGIGAGPDCDGQVLVIYDLLGLSDDFEPRFLKRYAELSSQVRQATECYAREVRRGIFPDTEHSY